MGDKNYTSKFHRPVRADEMVIFLAGVSRVHLPLNSAVIGLGQS
jgi:hypothetical protein